jgi:hypothetical protein
MDIRGGLCSVAAVVVATVLMCSCGGHASSARWQPVTTAGVEVLTPLGWHHARPPAVDPTVRLLLIGPRVGRAPRGHFVLRVGPAPTTGSLSDAVRSYEQIGKLRNPTTAWQPPRSLQVRGCRQAVELIGDYRAGDKPTGPLVHTLDVFLQRSDGVPEHLFASAGGATLSSALTSRLLASMSVSP